VNQPMWRPSQERIAQANLTRFMHEARSRYGIGASDYPQLYEWSIREPEQFWMLLWSYCGVIGDPGSSRVLVDGDRMPGAKWFPDARLNFAENLLRRSDSDIAIVFRGEAGAKSTLT
jgi:acetoacetyl-CoA synthetase